MTCGESCPARMWCAWSGGKDGAVVADLLAEEGRLEGVLFIDTGIALPDVRPFVEETCAARGWPLEVVRTPVVYEDWVARWGFPGPPQHSMVMNALKGRAIRIWKKNHPGEHLASGVRSGESARRSLNAKPHSEFEGVPMHAPIHDWSTERVWARVKERGLPRSPGYETLHIGGDCLCGSFSEPDEIFLLRAFYPEVADRLLRLEESVASGGRIRNPLARRWGGGMRGLGAVGERKQSRIEAFLCGSCEADRVVG